MKIIKSLEDFTKEVKVFLKENDVEKPLIVSGKTSFIASKAKIIIDNILQEDYLLFNNFSPNPTLIEIENGIKELLNNKCDAIIAIGGGTALDIGKSISVLSQQTAIPAKYIVKEEIISIMRVPLLLIPTTAGTGSEATQFAVVYMNNKKYSLDHPFLLPDAVVLYPALTHSLSRIQTAVTGADALAQAVEALWNVNANNESDNYAKEAIKLIVEHLPKAVEGKIESREEMLKASYLSGKAINITRTTAPHAVSYYLTSKYGISHGQAVAVTLPSFLRYNAEVTKNDCINIENYQHTREKITLFCEILGEKEVIKAKQKLEKFFENIGIKTSLKELNIPQSAIDEIINNVNLDRLKNNPRKLNKEQLRRLIEELFR